MKFTEIIKDAFLFPSKNIGRFAIYLLLVVLMVAFALGGILTYLLGIFDGQNYLLGGMYLIISMLIGFLVAGYHIRIIKSGIERDEEVPVFELFENFMTGFDNILVLLAYYLIPAILVVLIAFDTKLFDYAAALCQEFVLQIVNVLIMGSSPDLAVNALTPIVNNLMGSISITIIAGLILFAIFTLFQFIGESRLAKTGSLKEALNILESMKDIKRIGVGRTILLLILVLLIMAIIDTILISVLTYYPFLLLVFMTIITPYWALVTRRALGLLYSNIT